MKLETTQSTIKKIPKKVLRMIQLSQNEIIQFHLKVSFLPIFVNGDRQARISLLITSQNIILVDYYRFPIRSFNNFREQDIVPLSSVTNIAAKMKKFTLAKEPVISFNTSTNDVYEIVFYKRKKCQKIFYEIVDIIKRINPKVEVEIDIPDSHSWTIRPEW